MQQRAELVGLEHAQQAGPLELRHRIGFERRNHHLEQRRDLVAARRFDVAERGGGGGGDAGLARLAGDQADGFQVPVSGGSGLDEPHRLGAAGRFEHQTPNRPIGRSLIGPVMGCSHIPILVYLNGPRPAPRPCSRVRARRAPAGENALESARRPARR